MVMPAVTRVQLSVQMGLCVTLALLITVTTGSVCYTSVDSLDLGYLLQWDCPHASPNTTYTVQTKTQGDPWQDVTWCVWVSSHSCDVSGAFSNYELYYMIRLGVHLRPGSTLWTKPRKFDYSDFTFSPPSVYISLNGDKLSVQVQFPCAASRRCSLKSCCPVSRLIDPWTTVTVYNQLNHSDYQSRTIWTQEVASYVEFSDLAPGRDYCAVANFSFPSFSMAASPKSHPQCVKTAPDPGRVPVFVGIGLCSAVVAPLLIFFLLKQREVAPTAENQPKAPASLEEPVSLVPLSLVPVDLRDIHVVLVEDHISIESSSSGASNQDQASDLGDGSNANLQSDSESGTVDWDSRGTELD